MRRSITRRRYQIGRRVDAGAGAAEDALVRASGGWGAAVGLLAVACSETTVLTVDLPGAGSSSVLVLPSGAFALERTTAVEVPALSDDLLTSEAVLLFDYGATLEQLRITPGPLADDPAGQRLPAVESVFRLVPSADGEAAEWVVVPASAVDTTRRFGGIGTAVPCVTLTAQPISTGTVALMGEPRFLFNAGPEHLWIGLAGQPVRAFEHGTGKWSSVELPGGTDVLVTGRGEYAYDGITTIRERAGQLWYESWEVDHGVRPGQVKAEPRFPPVALPAHDYRWLLSPILQPDNLMYALAADGVLLRYDAGRDAEPRELARWTPTFDGPVRGALAANRVLDVVAVLSDSSTVRWLRRGSTEIQEAALGSAALINVDAGGGTDDFIVTAADGAVFVLRSGAAEWVPLGRTADGEALTSVLGYDDQQFLAVGALGHATSWRYTDGACGPGVALGGRPVPFELGYLVAPDALVALGREDSGRVTLTRITVQPGSP